MTATIYLLPYRRSEWNEPLDGVVYGGAAGIGYGLTFTTLWSFLDTATAGFRSALFAIPTFMLTGLIIGHYVSQTRFGPPHKARSLWRRGPIIAGLFLLGFELAQLAGGQVIGGDNPVASVVVYAANTLGWLIAMWAMDIGKKASAYDPATYRFQLAASGCRSCQSPYPVGATYCNRCGRPVAGEPREVQG
jgi:RsiW-degrading membrane proteinase PrsW (M82 family)